MANSAKIYSQHGMLCMRPGGATRPPGFMAWTVEFVFDSQGVADHQDKLTRDSVRRALQLYFSDSRYEIVKRDGDTTQQENQIVLYMPQGTTKSRRRAWLNAYEEYLMGV